MDVIRASLETYWCRVNRRSAWRLRCPQRPGLDLMHVGCGTRDDAIRQLGAFNAARRARGFAEVVVS